jgi:hypothetical protein
MCYPLKQLTENNKQKKTQGMSISSPPCVSFANTPPALQSALETPLEFPMKQETPLQ